MINYIWAFMIILGIIYSIITGNINVVNSGITENLKSTLETIMTMIPSMCLWQGLINIADKNGLIDLLANKFQKVLKLIFDTRNLIALKYISINIIANMIGIGACATPAGLMAIKELQKENDNKDLPSHDMCMFILINISSVQLVSMNLIMYRASFNSTNPSMIVMPGIIATTITTIFAIIFAIVMKKIDKKIKKKKIENKGKTNNETKFKIINKVKI